MSSSLCPFCALSPERSLFENDLAIGFADAFPVTAGHSLVIPKRHAIDYFELTSAEVIACSDVLHHLRESLLRRFPEIAGFNVGLNVGAAAGQTVFHAHWHLIPRRHGDVAEPHGGIRHVIPGKGLY
jgi:diadenosine tetraphosphate (Ap4A) HIT family hydrolase